MKSEVEIVISKYKGKNYKLTKKKIVCYQLLINIELLLICIMFISISFADKKSNQSQYILHLFLFCQVVLQMIFQYLEQSRNLDLRYSPYFENQDQN